MHVADYIYKFIFCQEAHAMVRAAKVKQVGAEKRFKEANNKVSGNVTPLCLVFFGKPLYSYIVAPPRNILNG